MAKFYGLIGYVDTIETVPGVWEETIVEKTYRSGDVIRNTRKWDNSSNVNDSININNSISIIADPFAFENLHSIRYVKWMGVAWKVTNIEIQRPRLVLTLGGKYNGE